MREGYDFSGSLPNPHAERLRKPVTVNLDVSDIEHLKAEAKRTGVPYQPVTNMHPTERRGQEGHLDFP